MPSTQLAQVSINIGTAAENNLPNAEADWRTDAAGNFGDFISRILNIVLIVGTIAVLFYLILGGIEWITAGGDKGKTEGARNKITQAVIGLVILASSWAIFLFVQQLLGIGIFSSVGGAGASSSSALCVPSYQICNEMGGFPGGGLPCPGGQISCTR